MQSNQFNRQGADSIRNSKQRRFRIVKLEERIAPAKGGIPGKPGDHIPPGQNKDSCEPWIGWGGYEYPSC